MDGGHEKPPRRGGRLTVVAQRRHHSPVLLGTFSGVHLKATRCCVGSCYLRQVRALWVGIGSAVLVAVVVALTLVFPTALTTRTKLNVTVPATHTERCGQVSLLPERRVPPREITPGTWQLARTSALVVRSCDAGTLTFKSWSAAPQAPSPPVLEVQQNGRVLASYPVTSEPVTYRVEVARGDVDLIFVNGSAFQRPSGRVLRVSSIQTP